VARIVRMDDVKARLEGMGTIPVGGTPEEFASFIGVETAKWGQVIRNAKVTAE
jgi:tripartite-type tricarboxylate transporter receptor subunit TctC